MEKRIFLFIGILFLIIMGSTWLNSKDAPQDNTLSKTTPTDKKPDDKTGGATALSSSKTTPNNIPVLQASTQTVEKQKITLLFPGYSVTFSNKNAGVTSFLLGEKQYKDKDASRLVETLSGTQVATIAGDNPIDVISNERGSLELYLPDSEPGLKIEEYRWSLVAVTPSVSCNKFGADSAQQVLCPIGATVQLVYQYKSPQIMITKYFELSSNNQINLTVSIKNLLTTPIDYHFAYKIRGFQPSQEKASWFDKTPPVTEVLWNKNSVQRVKFEKLSGVSDDDKVGNIRWVGLGPQYFLQAVAMPTSDGQKKLVIHSSDKGEIELGVEYPKNTLSTDQLATYKMVMYGGPKSSYMMEQVKIDGVGVELESSLNYTLAFLAKPLLAVLIKVNEWVKNWALSILILTILLKLITLYPSYRGAKSMKAVGELKPEVDALQEKYKDDKERLQQEIFQLYRRKGVSQFGGCLPMLIPMPIYFAFYSMLQSAVEFYRVPFLWIKDMTATDPYFILPLLTALIMHLQARFTPSNADEQQKKISYILMPGMFLFFGAFYIPAGLVFYILTNTILGVIQQIITNKIQTKDSPNVQKAKKG